MGNYFLPAFRTNDIALMHKHADIAIYTLRCKVTKENDFSKYVKPKTVIR